MYRDVRWEEVRRVRREIAAGTYITQAKLEAVADKLLGLLRDTAGRNTAQGGDDSELDNQMPPW